jgi:hypothetical protein
MHNEISHLVASQNEVRSQMRLPPLEMGPTPTPLTTSYAPPAAPISSQWLHWSAQESVDNSEEPESSEDHANGAMAIDPHQAELTNNDPSNPITSQW